MPLIKFTKKISCVDGNICSQKCLAALQNLCNFELNGHISIHHVNDKHQFWIFFYEKNGEHLGESNGEIIKTKAENIKKYTVNIPTEKELKKALDQLD